MESWPRRKRMPTDRRIKAEHLSIIVPLVIMTLIYLLLVVTELDSYIGTEYGVKGFRYVWPIPSGISLTSDGNLTMRFMNMWMARVTILNITVENNESGRCHIYSGNEIIYKNETHPLPFILPAWERFNINAFDCAPRDREIMNGDKFRIDTKTKYIIGEVFHMEGVGDIALRIFMRGMTVHEELGRVEGEYEMVYEDRY